LSDDINFRAMMQRHHLTGVINIPSIGEGRILDLSKAREAAAELADQQISEASASAQRLMRSARAVTVQQAGNTVSPVLQPFHRAVLRFFVRPTAHFSHLTVALIIGCIVTSSFFTGGSFSTRAAHAATTTDAPIQTLAMVASSSDLNVPIGSPTSSATEAAVADPGYINASTSPVTSHKEVLTATNYTVQPGDTLSTIAAKFNISTDTVLWANSLGADDTIKPGKTLTIPPVSGLLYRVSSGDTLGGIASAFHTDQQKIINANDLDPDVGLTAGATLMVPDGVKPAPAAPAQSQSSSGGSSLPSFVGGHGGSNSFPYGYCTWWVAHQRSVTWSGNAWEWYYNAQAAGRSVGKTPVPGSIMVTWESPVGHVAYVTAVHGNSFTVSEMNYNGWGEVDYRTLTTSSVPLIGFIY
jgi:surface antigen/nucleoid-associated protein YgaU